MNLKYPGILKNNRRRIIWSGVLILLILFIVRNCTYSENTNRRFITDKNGRSLILHGMNVNPDAKHDSLRVGWPQKVDYTVLSEKWGFNMVRYLVLWDGIEPQRDQYDTAYFSRIRERLDWCTEAGIFVILDMHQDLYALRYGGDGAPTWAIRDNGEPFELQTPWELNYRQPAVIASINNFWNKELGHPDLQAHYIKAFLELVRQFKDHPAVIGYDLYNEPTMATKEALAFEKRYLQPFYQELIHAIRTEDSDNWIFYEPTALGANQGFKSRLGKLDDPRPGEARLVYFPHIYTLDLDLRGKYLGIPLFLTSWAAKRNREAKRQDAPMLIGEFGLDGSQPGAIDFLDEVMKISDKILSGWAYWAYTKGGSWSPINKDGSEQEKMDILMRPYPQCVAGQPISYGYDRKKETFWLRFIPDSDIDAPSKIYLPENIYPEGGSIETDMPENKWHTEWDEITRVLQIFAGECEPNKYKITISPN